MEKGGGRTSLQTSIFTLPPQTKVMHLFGPGPTLHAASASPFMKFFPLSSIGGFTQLKPCGRQLRVT